MEEKFTMVMSSLPSPSKSSMMTSSGFISPGMFGWDAKEEGINVSPMPVNVMVKGWDVEADSPFV